MSFNQRQTSRYQSRIWKTVTSRW